ncbi:MAG: DUF512 domain-containing protein [Actinomycetota bacterium]|nr:DUF512 domain-containing protein [Actinomycetota bacterium]
MEEIRTCNNRCIFCFVNQLPRGLRKTLYVKDDDFLLSYMYGNFITLSNLSQADIKKIIASRLEPLYLSVHSLNHKIRKLIFGTENHLTGLQNFKTLGKNSIDMHIQVVLCPHINDGNALIETLEELIFGYSSVKSVGIVPVGLTRFNHNPRLRPVDYNLAAETIELVDNFNQQHNSYHRVFLSDEFYIIARRGFPGYQSYYDFCQINNGVGKSREFIHDFKKEVKGKYGAGVLLVTSEYGSYVYKQLARELGYDLGFKLLTVKNNFFGTTIKATGLLSGSDILKKLEIIDFTNYSRIIIPYCIFNQDGVTLDGYKKEHILGINAKLMCVEENANKLTGVLHKYG